jgi:hypothetical protein
VGARTEDARAKKYSEVFTGAFIKAKMRRNLRPFRAKREKLKKTAREATS